MKHEHRADAATPAHGDFVGRPTEETRSWPARRASSSSRAARHGPTTSWSWKRPLQHFLGTGPRGDPAHGRVAGGRWCGGLMTSFCCETTGPPTPTARDYEVLYRADANEGPDSRTQRERPASRRRCWPAPRPRWRRLRPDRHERRSGCPPWVGARRPGRPRLTGPLLAAEPERASWIERAALRPAPMALITVAAPVTRRRPPTLRRATCGRCRRRPRLLPSCHLEARRGHGDQRVGAVAGWHTPRRRCP